MNYGVIDLGSNTIRLVIYKATKYKLKIIYAKKESVALVSYLDKEQNLSETGINLLTKYITKLKKEASNFELKSLDLIATHVLRASINKEEIKSIIKRETQLDIEILSSEKEALYGILGLKYEFSVKEGLIVDVSGGSTKVSYIKKDEIVYTHGINIGALTGYIQYVDKVVADEYELIQLKEFVYDNFKKYDFKKLPQLNLYGIGGTFKALEKVIEEYLEPTMTTIKAADIKVILKELIINYKKNYLQLFRLIPEKIHTFLPGVIIIDAILDYYEIENVFVGKNGIREGYVLAKINRESEI